MSLNPTSFTSRLLLDLKERFLNFNTVRGAFLIPLALIGIWIAITSFQYILHALAAIIFVLAIVEGLYQFFHNPIKKAANIDKLTAYRNRFDADVKLAVHETEDFLLHMKQLIEKKLGTNVAIVPFSAEFTSTAPAPKEPATSEATAATLSTISPEVIIPATVVTSEVDNTGIKV